MGFLNAIEKDPECVRAFAQNVNASTMVLLSLGSARTYLQTW